MRADTAYIGSLLWLPRTFMDLKLLQSNLTFTPQQDYTERSKAIRCWADTDTHIGVPLYMFGSLHSTNFRSMFRDTGTHLIDLRPKQFEAIDIHYKVRLDAVRPDRDVQKRAVAAMLQNESGVVVLACGMGKSVVALHVAAQFKAPFIIVVDSKGLQQQWAGEARSFLMDSAGNAPEIGFVGDRKRQWDRPIVIALVQSLHDHAKNLSEDIKRRFAVSIWDECDLLGAPKFSKAAPLFFGRRYGLSATPQRADGLEEMYYLHLGQPIIRDLRQDLKPLFYFYRTQKYVDVNSDTYRGHVMSSGTTNIPNLFTYLVGIPQRTAEIIQLVNKGVQAGRKIMVVSHRLDMLDQLKAAFPDAGVIKGDVSGDERDFVRRNKDVILCQLRLAAKAFNKQDLDMMVICEPFRRDAIFQQVIGRVQRWRENKPTPIVVFVEDPVGPCLGMCKHLKKLINNWPEEQGGPFSWRYVEDGRQQSLGGFDW